MKNIETEDYNRIADNLAKSGTSPDEAVELTKEQKKRLEEVLGEED